MNVDFKHGHVSVDMTDLKEPDLTEGMSDEELFSVINHSDLESEKITAPRYSYWQSVFRVFFRKKINIVMLSLLGLIVLMAYLYPIFVEYDKFGNLLNASAKHLTPKAAIDKFGFSIHWLLGAGAAGQSTFDAIWYGSQISISLALIVALINMTVGVLVGAIWGFSKKVDNVMMIVYNIIANLPYILVISVMVMIFSAGFWTMVFAMTITGWLMIAYFIRTLKEMSLGRLIFEAESAMLTPGWGFEFWSPVAVASIITIVLYVVGQNLGDASDPRTHM